MAWLYNILRDGTLLDNQTYWAKDGTFTNQRFKTPFVLEQRGYRAWEQFWNNDAQIWHFLNCASVEVSESLKSLSTDSIVLFNEREYQHNTSDEFMSLHGTDARNFCLATGNIIGHVKKGDYSLKISSRFGDEFLRYIIADADGFLELQDYGGQAPEGDYEWLLVYLWLIKLKRACRLGLPKAYVSKTETMPRARGSICPVEYRLQGERAIYKCTYREHSYCNPATMLISETFNQLFKKLEEYAFLREAHALRNSFQVATEGKRGNPKELFATPHFTNPFYSDYNGLIDLSKQILRNKGTDFGEKSDTSAFLFDVSMLFEYFVRKLIKRSGAQLQGKEDRRLDIPAGRRGKRTRRIEPDLVFEMDGRICVLDVKYKTYDFHGGVRREDLFQLHTYVGQCSNHYDIALCGLIYPISEERWDAEGLKKTKGMIKDTFCQSGRQIPFHVFFLKVPAVGMCFQQEFSKSCADFIEAIKDAETFAVVRRFGSGNIRMS